MTTKIQIMDGNAIDVIALDPEQIVHWMQLPDGVLHEAAMDRYDDIEAACEAGNIEGLQEILRTIDDDVRVEAVPDTARCRCGYEWEPRTPNPKSCPRCKRYL